jgi:putative PIN family toxin of toxin-antitoxin system
MAEPLRVVIDPNVLVSAAIAGGAPRRIVELVAAGAIRMVTCPQLHDELEGVLARERFLRWRTREQLDRFVADISVLAHRLPDPTDVPAVSRDPNDDYLIALFRASEADVLCSGDGDLAAVDGLEVLSPRDLLNRLVSPSPPAS